MGLGGNVFSDRTRFRRAGKLATLGAVAALSFGIAACGGDDNGDGGNGDGDSNETVKIGYMASLTGPAAADAQRDVTGAELAVEEINADGGVDGRQLEMVVVDDTTDPTTAAREARNLALSEQVNVLAGGGISSVAASIKQAANNLKVPYIISTAAAKSLTSEDTSPYVYRAWADSDVQLASVAEYASSQPWTKYAILYGNFEYGVELKEAFQAQMEQSNPDIEYVAEIPVDLTESDFSGPISRLRSAQPDVIFTPGVYGTAYLGFAKQAVPAGLYKNAHVISFIGGAELDELGRLLPPGQQIGYNAFYPQIDDPFATDFAQRVEDASGEIADGSNLVGYMTIQWIAEAIRNAGSAEPQAIADALPDTTLDTYIGEVRMEDNSATGSYWYGIVTREDGTPTITDLGTAGPEGDGS